VTPVSRKDVTIGIDIGTTAVKAVAVADDGNATARVRIPHQLRVPAPGQLEHDADEAWRRGPLTALRQLAAGPEVRAVAVSAMVPSLTAVDTTGEASTPGLLYGDERGRVTGDQPIPTLGEAAELLRNLDLPQLNFIGFVEGGGIGKGAADVIVTEGFSGNISIKVAEGTARQISEFLRAELSRTWRAKIGYLLARNAFKALRDKLDPNKSNGGVFLGLNGIVVKSHGDATPDGFAYAVDVGYEMVHYDLLTKINQMLNRDGSALSAPTAQEAVS